MDGGLKSVVQRVIDEYTLTDNPNTTDRRTYEPAFFNVNDAKVLFPTGIFRRFEDLPSSALQYQQSGFVFEFEDDRQRGALLGNALKESAKGTMEERLYKHLKSCMEEAVIVTRQRYAAKPVFNFMLTDLVESLTVNAVYPSMFKSFVDELRTAFEQTLLDQCMDRGIHFVDTNATHSRPRYEIYLDRDKFMGTSTKSGLEDVTYRERPLRVIK